MDDKLYWIWLSMACTPGSSTFGKLLEKFEDAKDIYEASDDVIASLITSKSRDFKAITDKCLDSAHKVLDFCVQKKVGILTYGDGNYPALLRCISKPPVLLYYRGKLPNFEEAFPISVVGTRRLTEYGKRNAFTISRDLARAGALIVSGMAVGIDGVSQAGALSCGAATVAVIGSGIDICYPKSHLKLAREIVKNGCVMTEYAPGIPPNKENFPVRNRIISGLSNATLVIEGKERSGALLTARHAKEQNRAVYAVPGNVNNPTSQLSHLLIKNGAKLCTSADDIIRDFVDKSGGIINPFDLVSDDRVSLEEELIKYSVSAVCTDDKIFKSKNDKKKITAKTNTTPAFEEKTETVVSTKQEQIPDGIDKSILSLYKSIPCGEEGCPIEELVNESCMLRDVMKGLLRLEMMKLVDMLPGERVRRKF